MRPSFWSWHIWRAPLLIAVLVGFFVYIVWFSANPPQAGEIMQRLAFIAIGMIVFAALLAFWDWTKTETEKEDEEEIEGDEEKDDTEVEE